VRCHLPIRRADGNGAKFTEDHEEHEKKNIGFFVVFVRFVVFVPLPSARLGRITQAAIS
jgi:hypothetical protein